MKINQIISGIVGLLVLWGSLAGQEANVSGLKRPLLEREYEIAKTTKSYFIFDFEAKTIALKVRGFVLKEWPIAKAGRWGRATGLNPYTLEKKSALHPPQRKDITPGKEETKAEPAKKADDLDILELEKMPVDYTLELPEEIRIIVRPKKKGLAAVFEGVGRFFSRGIGRPIKTIIRSLKKKPYTDIEIVFNTDKDAQGVYWSFFEGQKCLLIWPN